MDIISIISCGYFNDCKPGIVFGKGPGIIAAETKTDTPTLVATDVKPIIKQVTESKD